MTRAAASLLLSVAFVGAAHAQGYQCRTAPVGASSPNCASEAFVTDSQGYHLATTFAGLPACSSALKGYSVFISDSNVSTFRSTITGSGANAGLAVCDGTNWTFH